MACVLVWHLLGSVAVAAQLTSEDHATPDQERPVGTEYSIETAVRESLVESDRHYRDGSPLEALATLETFSFPDTPPVGFRAEDAHQPLPAALRHEVLWRQSRAALAGGLLEENERRAHEWARRGTEYGREAFRLKPENADGAYWFAANLGRLALHETNPRSRAESGEEAYQVALGIVESDPLHAGAHNVLGRSYFEVRSLPLRHRVLGRVFTSGDLLGSASWEGARFHLERAVQLDPEMIYYRVDLARLYIARDLEDLARSELLRVLELPAVQPPDRTLQDMARDLLDRL